MKKKSYHHGNLKVVAIEEAIILSKEKGLMTWSLRELASHMDVSHVALYKHFKDKKELLYSIAIKGYEELIEKTTFKKDFKTVGLSYIKFAQRNPVIFEAMFHPQLPPSGSKELISVSSRYLNLAQSSIIATKKDKKLQVFLKGWTSVHGYTLLFTSGTLDKLNLPKNVVNPDNFIDFLWES